MAQDYHLFHVRSEEFSGIKTDYNLPFVDQSQYISGFLSGSTISAEALKRVNEHNFARKSQYYLGQHILEDYIPKSDEPFTLKEIFAYDITLSGPGYNNTNNHSRFEDKWWKPAIKDLLTVKPDFSWDRSKEIDTDFYLKWKGNYTYTSGHDNSGLVVFSLSGQSYSGVFSGNNDNYIHNYGLMYGPIDNIHVFKEPVEKRISGIVTEIISSGIVATVSDTASGVIYGLGKGTAVGTAYYTFDGSVSAMITDIGYNTVNVTIAGVIGAMKIVSATGTARDTVISGLARGNAHDLLSQKSIDGYGPAQDVEATIPPTDFEISGYNEGKALNTYVESVVTKIANGIRIGGTGIGTAESVLFSCEDASGMVDSITIEGEVNDTLNNQLVSGIISGLINGIMIKGMASGYANNVSFSSSSSTTVSQMMRGQISEVINNIPISGPVSTTINGISVTGKVSGYVPEFSIIYLATMTVPDFVFSGYINGEVQGKINTSQIITDEIITDSVINDFKSRLYNNIEGIIIYQIGENELNFFGRTKDEIKTLYQNAINSVVDYNSIYNIISSAYLSKDATTDLTDKILFDMTIANGNYIKGDAKFLEALRGTISIDGDASLDGDIIGGEVTVDQGTGYINPNTSTDSGGQSAHNHTRNGHTTPNTTGGGGADGHTHGFNDYYETLSNSDIRHTHPIGEKGVTVNTGYGDITGGKTSITNGTIDIDEADFTATIPNETDIEIRGSNIDRFRNRIIFLIGSTITSILSNIQIDKILYDTVDEYEVTGNMSGIVSGYYENIIPTRVSGLVPGTGTGRFNTTISGPATNNVTHNISGIVFNQVTGEIEGVAQGTATALAYCVGSGYEVYDETIILSTAIDDSFSDMINYYEISGTSGVTTDNDIINPGGRGQLINYVAANIEPEYHVYYDVGSCEDNTSTILSGETINSIVISGVSGIKAEYTPLNDYFGMDGGNTIQNSFDFYEKHEPENGFARIIYGLTHFNTLEIITSGTVEVLPDETATIDASGIIYNQILANNEAEVYYRITERGQELDLVNSTLNGKALSGYIIKYEEPVKITPEMNSTEIDFLLKKKYKDNELYITEIDNQRRKLTFQTPVRSANNDFTIKLYLQTGRRKFYFAITRDSNIDTVTIDKKIYYPEDQEEDGSYRRHKIRNTETDIIQLDDDGNPIYDDTYYGLPATDEFGRLNYDIEVRFKNENDSLMKEVIRAYLNDCLDENKNPHNGTSLSISKSNNYIQTINPFIMPERDVLLFLKTEKLYLLTIFVEKGSHHIIEVIHEDDTITKIIDDIENPEYNSFFEVPIIARHFRDDKIIIRAKFSATDDENKQFYELDREYIESQLIEISRANMRYNDGTRFHEPFVGYNSDTEEIKFFMPARDATLYLREKDYRYKLKLLREINTTHFETATICSDNPRAEIPKETEDVVYNSILWAEFLYKEGDKIDITAHFMPEPDFGNGYFHRIDVTYMKAQMAEMGIEVRQFIDNTTEGQYKGFKFPDQKMSFTMPGKDVELVIKEESIINDFTIHPEQYQYNNDDFISRRIQGVIVKSKYYEFTSAEGVKIPIIAGELLEIYVKFADIYQHLENDYIISQEPRVAIIQAGIIDGIVDINENPVSRPAAIEVGQDEYYQFVGFKMPGNDFTLVLKWTERLYEIDFDINYKFIEYTDIFDSYVEYDESLNGTPTQMLQPRFPHYTYPKVLLGDNITIKENFMKIFSTLRPKMEITPDESYYELGYSYNEDRVYIDNNENSIVKRNETEFSFNMPKNDIYIFVRVGFKPGSTILMAFGIQSSITLERGRYQLIFGGARGGQGGDCSDMYGREDGHWGAGTTIEITVIMVTNVTYYLGTQGVKGFRGSGGAMDEGGGGGGGGGNSIITFDNAVEADGTSYKAFLCNGGNGGHGGNNEDFWSGDEMGGGGGPGGNNTGDGNGGPGGANDAGDSGGAPGGMGYARSYAGDDYEWITTNSNARPLSTLNPDVTNDSNEGYLIIKFIERLE